MLKNEFDYALPEHLIAQSPLARGESKLLVSSASKDLCEHKSFSDIVDALPDNSVLVLNTSRVLHARIFGMSSGRRFEVFLLERPAKVKGHKRYEAFCLARPGKKLKPGQRIDFDSQVYGEIIQRPSEENQNRFKIAIFCDDDIESWLEDAGQVPLPPYISREDQDPRFSQDKERYQTVFSNQLGSVAAPTAGLHFTQKILDRLCEKGVELVYVLLHVGSGTFLPVVCDDIEKHPMHSESYLISEEAYERIRLAKKTNKPLLAVGTTSFRCVEDLFLNDKKAGGWHSTSLFIRPESKESIYQSKVFTGMITNFHQPCSTLFMLICALLGYDRANSVYKQAIEKEYRFFSYGDSSLLWFKD